MITKSRQVFRLFGISVRFDWSLLLIFILITFNLTSFLGQFHPAWTDLTRWSVSILASVCFFASVLAHELAHALVARAQGVEVQDITLFFLGGVAHLKREPPTAKIEFMTAFAGPLTSLILGVSMVALGRGAVSAQSAIVLQPGNLIPTLSPLSTILLWLGAVNVLLAAFNMLPGFPLDGGRVLRAALWGLSKSFIKATRWTAWIGQAVAWMIMAVGFSILFGAHIPWLGAGLISALWLIFIGWFLNIASATAYQQAELRHRLEGVPVINLMRRDNPTVEPGWLLSDLSLIFRTNSEEQAFPVLAENLLVGIITREDLDRIPQSAWSTTRIEQIMTSGEQLATIAPHEDASQAMETLLQHGVRQLPVVRENCEFLGLLRRRDILRWLQVHQEASRV